MEVDPAKILEFFLGTAAGGGVLLFIAKSYLSNLFERGISRYRSELARLDAIDAERRRGRGEGYEKIWSLTGTLALFGPASDTDGEALSLEMKDWYFSHGQTLSGDCKDLYFLIQEVLNFARTRSIPFRRPDENVLYGSAERPVDVLASLRADLLKACDVSWKPRTPIAYAKLAAAVTAWKSLVAAAEHPSTKAEDAWLLLQHIQSAFRTAMLAELESPERMAPRNSR